MYVSFQTRNFKSAISQIAFNQKATYLFAQIYEFLRKNFSPSLKSCMHKYVGLKDIIEGVHVAEGYTFTLTSAQVFSYRFRSGRVCIIIFRPSFTFFTDPSLLSGVIQHFTEHKLWTDIPALLVEELHQTNKSMNTSKHQRNSAVFKLFFSSEEK